MVFDHISNANQYYGLNTAFKTVFDFLKQTDFINLTDGKHPIKNTNCIAIINRYKTKSADECFAESHLKNIDIQYLVKGEEKLGFGNINHFTMIEKDVDNDLIKYTGKLNFISLKENFFSILFPQDVHMPGVINDQQENVIKVVVKIPV